MPEKKNMVRERLLKTEKWLLIYSPSGQNIGDFFFLVEQERRFLAETMVLGDS